MKRKLIVILLAALFVFFGAISWAQASQAKKHTYNLTMVLSFPTEETPRYWGAKHFVEEVEKRTGGQVKIRLSPTGEIVSNAEAIPALKAGTIVLLDFPPVFFQGETWSVYWNMIPGNCENYKLVETQVKSGIFDLERDALRKVGIEFLGSYEIGNVDAFIARKKFFTVPQDLKGVKIRGFGGPHNRAMAELGARTVTLPMDELYMALQTGVVDAAITALPSYEGFRQYEVAPKVTYVPTMPLDFSFSFNKKYWDALPADIQGAFRSAMKNTQNWILPRKKDYYAHLLPTLRKLGAEIYTPPIGPWINDYGKLVRKNYLLMGGDVAKKVEELLGK